MSVESEQTNAVDLSSYSAALKARAAKITCVRNDIFSLTVPQIAINFVLGGGAIAGLIGSMTASGTLATVFTIAAIVLVIVFIVYNFALRTISPMSVMQYTYLRDGTRYVFQILSKKRSAFSDGVNHIEVERGNATRRSALCCDRYRFDFFADMEITSRTVNGMIETFAGVYAHNGKRYKCKIAFDGETPLYGTIGGGRIKYNDINNNKHKFIVPTELRAAVKSLDVIFPKLPTVKVSDQ